MSDLEKTRLVCEIYKKTSDATAIADLKIPSLVNNLKSKTLMKLIGFYREKKIPIDIIVLFMDLEKRPFSIFKFVFALMKIAKDIESKIPIIENQVPQEPVVNLFSFKGMFSDDPANTKASLQVEYGPRQQELLKAAQSKMPFDDDALVMLIQIKCNSPEDANDFKDELISYVDQLKTNINELVKEKRLESFCELLQVSTTSDGDHMICRITFDYPALLPCITRFKKYLQLILGPDSLFSWKTTLDSQYDCSSFRNPLKLLTQMLLQPKTNFKTSFEYSCLPSLIKLWMQHLRQEAKKTYGPKYNSDLRYKNIVKTQALLHFLMGSKGLKIETEYIDKDSLSPEQTKAFVKSHQKYFFTYLRNILEWYRFAKAGNINSFVVGIRSLQDIVEQLYQYCVFDMSLFINAPPLAIHLDITTKGFAALVERFITI